MDFFLQQLRFNLEIVLENISIKYNLNKNNLIKLYLPKKLNKKIQSCLSKTDENLNCKSFKEVNLNYKFFKDRNNNLYYVINNYPIKYNLIYDSIKIK